MKFRNDWEWHNRRWFNLSPDFIHWQLLSKRMPLIKWWNLFNKHSTWGHFWGIGLLQIGGRHLLYVGCGPHVQTLFCRLVDRSDEYANRGYEAAKARGDA